MSAMKRRATMRALAVGGVVVMGLAACSGSDSDSAENTSASIPSTGSETIVAETATPETTVAVTTPDTTSPEPKDVAAADPLDLAPGESIVFEVEVTVTESTGQHIVGDVLWMPNCYTLTAEGVFIDPGFPRSDGTTSGKWTSEWDGTTATYEATTAGEGVVIEQTGVVTIDQAAGTLSLTADSWVLVGGDFLVRLTSTGQAVDVCIPSRLNSFL